MSMVSKRCTMPLQLYRVPRTHLSSNTFRQCTTPLYDTDRFSLRKEGFALVWMVKSQIHKVSKEHANIHRDHGKLFEGQALSSDE